MSVSIKKDKTKVSVNTNFELLSLVDSGYGGLLRAYCEEEMSCEYSQVLNHILLSLVCLKSHKEMIALHKFDAEDWVQILQLQLIHIFKCGLIWHKKGVFFGKKRGVSKNNKLVSFYF